MLRHIVMMKFSDRENWESTANIVTHQLNDLSESIPELLHIETGINMSKSPAAYDLVLTADFENETGLEVYRVHPKHLAVLQYMKKTVDQTVVVDYYTN